MPLTPLERALLILDHERAEEERASRAAELEDERGRLEASLLAFTEWAWPLIDPTPFRRGRDTDAIIQHAEAFYLGQIPRLILNIQPGSGKTLLFSIIPDAWMKARDPRFRLVSCSNSDGRAAEHSTKTRALMLHPDYQRLWARKLKAARGQADEFELQEGGSRVALNFNGKLQGPGGDVGVADDPQTESDTWSPTTLARHLSVYRGGWTGRLRNKETGPLALVAQRLGPYELPNALRSDDPNEYQILALEGRKLAHGMITYYKTKPSGEMTRIDLPRIDTALSRDGRFVDDRQPGEILSPRTPLSFLEQLERVSPSVYWAQYQQAPILASAEGARIAAFKRELHLRSFATRMGRSDLRSAVECALADGWKVGCGWDHGLEAHREIGQLAIWSERDREAWALGASSNPEMQTVVKDAVLFRESILDPLGIPVRRMVQSRGDVGNMGKGTAGGSAGSINIALSKARYEDGARKGELVLGFPIGTASKGATLAEQEIAINEGFGAGALYLDDSAALLAVALECWTGGEGYKDRVDAWRYVIWPILQQWRALQPGRSGFASR